ncbi:MAG: hypothetical protein J7L72_08575 [Candidatus Aminicenantes bacterium]|nr:hypothetical protein [Candidatus Aminicenantes bacterium]
MSKKCIVFVCITLLLLPFVLSAQTHPEEFLGHKVGADRKLADYTQITDYFKKLAEESNRIQVLTIGKSTLGKPIIMAVITDEDNMDKLDAYTQITRRLRDARGLSTEEAKNLAKQGKAILLLTCNIHSTEIASSQMAMELAYDLVTGNTPFDSESALKDVIVLLVPSTNPDGEQMVTEWYRKWVGTKHEGSSMPWLYHPYAGHDDNRDWFMFNLKETRAVTKVLYHDWIPQIHIDEHQMGSTGARLFIPPFMNPPVPTIHPLLWRGVALCGTNMAYDLQKNGFKGVVHERSFTAWWIGACDDTSWLHNCIGLLSEMASVRVATPIYIDPTEIPDSYMEKRLQFPDPWMGGWWRLRDIVDYELTLSKSLVETAYIHKEDFLFNFYKMCRDEIEIREEGNPFAFVISKDQRDYPTTLRMLEILKLGGIEIHRAQKDFIADGKFFPAGSFVVLMSQPYRPYAQSLLEKQEYPDMRQYPGGPPEPPYDNAGWTLPLQMGVACEQIDTPFETELVRVDEIPDPEIQVPSEDAKYIVLDSKQNASYSVVFSLLKTSPNAYRSKEPVNGDGFHTCFGSFLIENTPQVQKELPALLEKWNVKAYPIGDISHIQKDPLTNPRIALYQSWKSNMDEGWTRYVLDDLEIPYTTIHNKDFKDKKDKPADLKDKFDVIVFASESPDIIKTGKPGAGSRYSRYYTEGPPEYEGGIGKEGVEALKTFVSEGGILVTLNDACKLAIQEFKPPVSNTLDGVSRDKFFCPTSILKVNVDPKTPIGYGMNKETAVVFSRSLAFRTNTPGIEWDRTVVASYPKKDVLLSGWLLGEDTISRSPAVVDVTYKKGHLILIGIRCQHRAQSHGSYKFLLNAMLYPQSD